MPSTRGQLLLTYSTRKNIQILYSSDLNTHMIPAHLDSSNIMEVQSHNFLKSLFSSVFTLLFVKLFESLIQIQTYY